MVIGAKGVLGRRPLPDEDDCVEDDERDPPRKERKMWLKLLLAFEVELEGAAAVAVCWVCGVSAGERKRDGSMTQSLQRRNPPVGSRNYR